MKSLGKVCKSAQVDGKNWRQELQKILLRYHATPHSSTGIAPLTALNGYPLKTKLPQLSTFDSSDLEKLENCNAASKEKMKRNA